MQHCQHNPFLAQTLVLEICCPAWMEIIIHKVCFCFFKGSESPDIFTNMILCWTCAQSTLIDTSTMFAVTYLLSHTHLARSSSPWWRLIAALRACWAPPVMTGASEAAPFCGKKTSHCPGARSITEDCDRLCLWSQIPHLGHQHRPILSMWQPLRVPLAYSSKPAARTMTEWLHGCL